MQQTYSDALIATLRHGGVAIMRTDTIYGIVGLATHEATVERIYRSKQRTPTKSPIILIGDISQMFDRYNDMISAIFPTYWPGPNSLILPSSNAPTWIIRDNASVAYRLPADQALRKLLIETGPLIAPSANPEGAPPALSIVEARAYFGAHIDHYEDGGICRSPAASRIYKVNPDATVTQLR